MGIIAGWLAERITGRNHGLLTNLIVGIVGAFLGGFIFSSLLGFRYEEGFNLPSIVVATVGAVVLLAVTGGFRQSTRTGHEAGILCAGLAIPIFAVQREDRHARHVQRPARRDRGVGCAPGGAGKLMDGVFVVPGTNFRLGLDAVIGLVPVAGDMLSALISSYLIWEARRLGAPRWLIARMVANTFLDTTLGAVPLLGDAFDVMFRANMKNMALLRKHMEKRGSTAAQAG